MTDHDSDAMTLADGVVVRPLQRDDAAALTKFAAAIPPHDLLFLRRDIREPRVVAAWLDHVEDGSIRSMVALDGDRVVGCSALVRDPLSWSRHVGEVRVLVNPAYRGSGLGGALVARCMEDAAALGLGKLVAQMTPDQGSAMTLFERHGFAPEALLRDQVRDADGTAHTIAVMARTIGSETP